MKHLFTEVANHFDEGENRLILIETDSVESAILGETVDTENNTVQVAIVTFDSGNEVAVLWPGDLKDFAVALGVPQPAFVRTFPEDDESGDF
jgi:hypothetical protein